MDYFSIFLFHFQPRQLPDPVFYSGGDEKGVSDRQRCAGFGVGSEKASLRPSQNLDGGKPSIRRSEDRQRDFSRE